jgi:hypothetical protein
MEGMEESFLSKSANDCGVVDTDGEAVALDAKSGLGYSWGRPSLRPSRFFFANFAV